MDGLRWNDQSIRPAAAAFRVDFTCVIGRQEAGPESGGHDSTHAETGPGQAYSGSVRDAQRRAELMAIAAENETVLTQGFYQHPETGTVANETAVRRAV